MIRTTVDKYLFTVNFPLIVEIPDRNSTKAGRPGIREMVNAAIGLKL
jgi:vacuolar-type H+-ATPase subunit F/Vma7